MKTGEIVRRSVIGDRNISRAASIVNTTWQDAIFFCIVGFYKLRIWVATLNRDDLPQVHQKGSPAETLFGNLIIL